MKMTWSQLGALTLVGALAALPLTNGARPAEAQVPLRFEAMIEPFEAGVSKLTFPTLSPKGRPLRPTTWRVVTGTGNARENYLASTESGMLLDFGGEWLRFSEDEGRTWSSVLPSEDRREWWSFEGAVAIAPGGDVVAAGQDSLIDGVFRAPTFKYEAASDAWYYSVAESSQPFLDRPSIGVLPGPFEIGGTTVPYISVLRGGLLLSKSYWSYSFDGLNYEIASSRFFDSVTSLPETEPLAVDRWKELDWMQSHDMIGVTPLGRGRALAERPSMGAFDTEAHAPRTVLDPTTLRWKPYEFRDGGPPQTSVSNCVEGVNYPPCLSSEGRTLADSRGNLHHVVFDHPGTITYWFSPNGAKTWTKTETPLLKGYKAPSNPNLYKTFKVSGAHAKTAVAVHTIESDDPPITRDLVYVFSFRDGTPKVKKIHVIGEGTFSCSAGDISGGGGPERFCDFPSLTFVRGGRIAVSFTDAKHPEPAVAIQVPRR